MAIDVEDGYVLTGDTSTRLLVKRLVGPLTWAILPSFAPYYGSHNGPHLLGRPIAHLAHDLADHSRDHVGCSARRERNHQLHRLGRVFDVLRLRHRRSESAERPESGECGHDAAKHAVVPQSVLALRRLQLGFRSLSADAPK